MCTVDKHLSRLAFEKVMELANAGTEDVILSTVALEIMTNLAMKSESDDVDKLLELFSEEIKRRSTIVSSEYH